MNYYKDVVGNVYAYSDIQTPVAGLIEMTQGEIEAHLNPPALAPKPKTVFAPREYLRRFTMDEYTAVRTGPIEVQYALDNLIGAQFVDIDDPDVVAGLDVMVLAGIIDAARKAELLTPEPVGQP